MEHEDSLSLSQEPATCPYPEPDLSMISGFRLQISDLHSPRPNSVF
jgi:hypothetical protein